jgi:hypothetical protein
MTQTIKGKVEAINDREDEDWYGVKVDGDWYNGNDSLDEDIEEGDMVAIKYTEEENADSSWNSIQNIKRTGGTGLNSGSKAGRASNSSLSKNQRITANTAVQSAAKKVPLDDADDQAEHVEQVNKLANAYRRIIEGQMDAMRQEDDGQGETE